MEQFLQPCLIEGTHGSLEAVMRDPESTTNDLLNFAGQAEDAVLRCNDDKRAIDRVLKENE